MSILFNGLQGSILGSLLFINCICDLFILNDHLEFGSYVDYTTASAFENNSEEILGELGKHMSNICEWFLHNCLRANAKKFHHFFKVQSCKLKEALINDRLLALKVSWKFRIPTINNFAVTYPWNLPFSWKVAYFLTVSSVFSVYKQNFKKETPEQVFPCEFCESFRTPFLQNTSERLLLEIRKCFSSAKL